MNFRAAPALCLPLLASLIACQLAPGLPAEAPIPGAGSAGGPSAASGVCLGQHDMGFDIQGASLAPTCAADCTEIGPALGRAGAEALAAELAPRDTFCSLDVSTDTQAVLDQAHTLDSQGKRAEALALLETRLRELGSQAAAGKASAAPPPIGSGDRQVVTDLLALGAQAAMWGGDDQPYVDSARSTFEDFAGQELTSADLQESIKIAEEAARLGMDDLEGQALDRAREIAERDYQEAAKFLDPCTVTKDALKDVMKKVQIAILLGVPSANENDNQAFADLLDRIQQAAAAVKNKEGGGRIEGCRVTGEFEITYTHYIVVGQHEPIVISTRVPFTLDLTQEPPGFHTEAQLNNDRVYTYPDLTVHNVAKFDLTLDVWYLGGSTPLQLDLGIKGGSEVTFGVASLSAPHDYDEAVRLTFPLTEGATQEFDIEGWKDWKEWKVTLHPTP